MLIPYGFQRINKEHFCSLLKDYGKFASLKLYELDIDHHTLVSPNLIGKLDEAKCEYNSSLTQSNSGNIIINRDNVIPLEMKNQGCVTYWSNGNYLLHLDNCSEDFNSEAFLWLAAFKIQKEIKWKFYQFNNREEYNRWLSGKRNIYHEEIISNNVPIMIRWYSK